MRPTITALLLAALAASCSSPTPSAPTPVVGLSGKRVSIEVEADQLVVRVAADGQTERPILARLVGLNLDEGESSRAIPLRGWRRADHDLLEVTTQSDEHQLLVRLVLDHSEDLLVSVTDRIQLRSPVAGLSLQWRFEAADLDEVEAPLAAKDGLTTDRDFRSPLLFVRSGSDAIGLLPDLDLLDRDRRLPQMLRLGDDAGATILEHGLYAESPRQFRGEELHFAHRLRLRTDATPEQTRAVLHHSIWAQHAAERLARSAYPLDELSWHLFEQRTLTDLDPLATSGLLYLGERHNLLHDAALLAREGQRLDRPDLQARADAIVQFVLSAPRRAGLLPAACQLDADTGKQDWLTAAPDSPDPESFRAVDAAATGRLLIAITELLPERREAIDSLCADLARFLLQNQADDGHIPALYEQQYLQPSDGESDSLTADTAGPAHFLMVWGEHSGDQEAADAARVALGYLADSLPTRQEWPGPAGSRGTQRPVPERSTATLARAIRATTALPAGDPVRAALIRPLVTELIGLQQAWQPLWWNEQLLGAFVDSNLAPRADATCSALAAAALFDAYRLTGSRPLLQRATMALRWAMKASEGSSEASLVTDVIDRQRRSLGQAVVDAGAGWAEGLDSVWLEDTRLAGGVLDFRLLTHSTRLETARVSVRALPDGQDSLEITGLSGGPIDADRLAKGVEIPTRRVARIEFHPPTELRDGTAWKPQGRIVGPSLRSASQWVVIEQEQDDNQGRIARIPMVRDVSFDENGAELIDGDDELNAERPFQLTGLAAGDRLQVWIEYEEDGRLIRSPTGDPHQIVIGTMNVIDAGDQDEPELVAGADDSSIQRYVDGRENARRVEPGQSLDYHLQVRKDALSLRLEIRHAGAMRVTTGDGQVLQVEHDQLPADESRTLKLQLSDPRRWRQDGLVLKLEPAGDDPLYLARLAWEAEGLAAPIAPELGLEFATRAPDPGIRAVVVPIQLVDRPGPASSEALREAFFGGSEYKRTPEPQPRLTVGSAATWIERLSGGLTTLTGSVAENRPIALPVAALGTEANLASLLDEFDDELASSEDPDAPTAICLVHGGGPLPYSGRSIEVGRFRVLLLAEREQDGSFLSCGTIVLGLMRALYGIEDLGPPEQGNFDRLMLSAAGGGHMPPAPSAANLERAGWCGHIRFGRDESGPVEVELAHILDGRTFLELDDDSLPDRGRLLLELRDGLPLDLAPTSPGAMPGNGLSIYRAMAPDASVFVRRIDGRSTTVRNWRIAADRPPLETPFVPGSGADLFADSSTLQQTWLTTPQGEAPWTIEDLHIANRRANMRCGWRGHDLLRREPSNWSAASAERGFGPLTADGRDRGFGSAIRSDDGFAFELPTRGGRTIRFRAMAGPYDSPSRLFGRIELGDDSHGSGELRVRIGNRTALVATLDPRVRDTERFVVDLPIVSEPTAIDVEFTTVDAGLGGRIERLVVVPLSSGSSRVPMQGLDRVSVRLADEVIYADTGRIRLDEDGNARLRVPLLLPAGQAGLRIHCGVRHGESRAVVIRAAVRRFTDGHRFDALDGLIVDVDSSPQLALIELPHLTVSHAALLDLTVEGQPGAELYLLDVAIVRR